MKTKWKYLIALLAGLFLYVGWRKEREQYDNQSTEKEAVIQKQESALETYKLWIRLYQMNKRIEDYLFKNEYHSVAIYGLGRVGKNLYQELSESEIAVDYVIDRWVSMAKGDYQSTLCYNPDAVLPKTDLIIIAVASEANEIALHLSDCGSPVVSMQDLLHRMISEM